MSTQKETTSNFKEPVIVEEEKKEPLSPAEYFEHVKSKMKEETSENVQTIYNTTMKALKKYMITGQSKAAKELYAKCLYLVKEQKLIDKGVTKYVLRTDIDKYIDDIADECVCVIDMKSFDRDIPDDIVDIVADTMDIFDEFYVVFTDYTGEKRSKVAKEKREKDPILFGNIFIDGRISPKMYFIGDWVDEYCDLTLDKMLESMSKKSSKKKDEFTFDIKDESSLDKIQEQLFGKNRTNSRII